MVFRYLVSGLYLNFLDKPYHIINLVLAGIILLIFLYSGLFSAEKNNYPIPSFYEKFTGKTSVSSGLSRSFSEIIRGKFESAREYNPEGISVFAFFLVQFFQRLLISLIVRRGRISLRTLIITDSILSTVCFLLCFRNFIVALMQNF